MFSKQIFYKRRIFLSLFWYLIIQNGYTQNLDSLKEERFTVHIQATTISQFKPAFSAKYTGQNSLLPQSENKLSYTSTLYLGARLSSGASLYLNPEIAGGSGLSSSFGVGASTNGESYRIDSPSPKIDLARVFLKQYISLNHETDYLGSDLNQIAGRVPLKYISIILGKISITDIFDNNGYSHDPRTQFMSWALMSNGAWDFPANTRGYTPSLVLEYVTPRNELRYGFSLVPTTPNGMKMNWSINQASSQTLEYSHNYTVEGNKGVFRVLSFYTSANMGNYDQSLALNPTSPSLILSEKYGNIKYGFGINAEQAINKNVGVFFRTSWNDGNNESWAFTEIDRSISLGVLTKGNLWNRINDHAGLAYVASGLSIPHRKYLKASGMGFELGDGNLNYSFERLAEFYYSLKINKILYISTAYQHIIHPGYNKDRGAVNVFSVRAHVKI